MPEKKLRSLAAAAAKAGVKLDGEPVIEMPTRECLVFRAELADDAYQAELDTTYGLDGCNARYDRKRHAATPRLAELRAAFLAAKEATR
jgi:hypothetical protein